MKGLTWLLMPVLPEGVKRLTWALTPILYPEGVKGLSLGF